MACTKAGLTAKSYPAPDPAKLQGKQDRKLSDKKVEESLMLARKKEMMAAYGFAVQAIELDSRNAFAYINRAMFFSMNGAHSDALEDCKLSVYLDANFVDGYKLLGKVLNDMKEPRAAIEYGLLNAVKLSKSGELDKELQMHINSAVNAYKKTIGK